MSEPTGEVASPAMPKVKIGVGRPSVQNVNPKLKEATTVLLPQLRVERVAMLASERERPLPLGVTEKTIAPMQRKLFPPPTTEQRNSAQRVSAVRTELAAVPNPQQALDKPSEKNAEKKPTSSHTLVTTDGKTYQLNLSENFTVDDMQQELRAQGSSALADRIDRYVSTVQDKEGKHSVAQYGQPDNRTKPTDEEEENEKTTAVIFVSTDGRTYHLTLPKNFTAEDIKRALNILDCAFAREIMHITHNTEWATKGSQGTKPTVWVR